MYILHANIFLIRLIKTTLPDETHLFTLFSHPCSIMQLRKQKHRLVCCLSACLQKQSLKLYNQWSFCDSSAEILPTASWHSQEGPQSWLHYLISYLSALLLLINTSSEGTLTTQMFFQDGKLLPGPLPSTCIPRPRYFLLRIFFWLPPSLHLDPAPVALCRRAFPDRSAKHGIIFPIASSLVFVFCFLALNVTWHFITY